MTADAARLLNRLFALHCRSFPQYLQYSRPYVAPGREKALAVVGAIARDQQLMAQRLGTILSDAEGLAQTGEFPMEFTDLHDLDIDHLLNEAIRYQAEDIAAIEAIVRQLQSAPAAKAAAEESLGMAKGHLESLKDAVVHESHAT